MAKKSLTLKRVYKLKGREYLRFRDKRNKFAKYDGRKKLIAEVWRDGKKTNLTINKISKGKPVPEKFPAPSMKKRMRFIKANRAGLDQKSETKYLEITIDARHTISDNIESKADPMLTDIVKISKTKRAASTNIEFFTGESNESISAIFRSTNKGNLALDMSRYVIARLYSNKLRMSGLKKSDIGDRAKYVRSIKVSFTWNATNKF